MHAHRISLLLDSGTFIFLSYSETLAMKPIIYVPAVDAEAHLDLLSYGEGRHFDGAWLYIAFQLGHKLWSETDREAIRVDTPSCRGGYRGRCKVFEKQMLCYD